MIVRGMIGVLFIALLAVASVQSSIMKPFPYSDPTVYEDLPSLHTTADSDLFQPEKRAYMRLGKRAYMRLGKRAYLRLGKRAPLRLG